MKTFFQMHVKYQLKSRSENAPHIYSVGDSAYQDALHHEEQQHIIFSGETLSGKTTNFKHLIHHLLYLGLVSIIVYTINLVLALNFEIYCSM